jgi:hypothetical protein
MATPSDIAKLRLQQLLSQYGGTNETDPNADAPSPLTSQPDTSNQDPFAGQGPQAGQGADQTARRSPTDIAGLMQQMNQIYTPTFSARDKMNELISQFPQHQDPSFARKVVASGMGWNSKDPLGTMNKVIDDPFLTDVEDWKMKMDPVEKAAQLEEQANANQRTLAGNILTNKYQTDRTLSQEAINQERNAIAKQKEIDANNVANDRTRLIGLAQQMPDWEEARDVNSPTVLLRNKKTGEIKDTGVKTGNVDAMTRIQMETAGKIATAQAGGAIRQTTQSQGNQQTGKNIILVDGKPYQLDANGVATPMQVGGADVTGSVTKVPTPSTANTDKINSQVANRMDMAQRMEPKVDIIKREAAELERRGLFGPIMGRIRDLSQKVGTTGDYQDVASSFQNHAVALTSDPQLTSKSGDISNDYWVSKFLSDLAFLTSGTGIVHGGQRGGGSIQMVNYMKSILGAGPSTLSSFNAKMDSAAELLHTYAQPPQGVKTPQTTVEDQKLKDSIRKALEAMGQK